MNKKIWSDQKFIISLWFKSKPNVLNIYLSELGLGKLENLPDKNRQFIESKTKSQLIRDIYNFRKSKPL